VSRLSGDRMSERLCKDLHAQMILGAAGWGTEAPGVRKLPRSFRDHHLHESPGDLLQAKGCTS
jgi:hypothetical protein